MGAEVVVSALSQCGCEFVLVVIDDADDMTSSSSTSADVCSYGSPVITKSAPLPWSGLLSNIPARSAPRPFGGVPVFLSNVEDLKYSVLESDARLLPRMPNLFRSIGRTSLRYSS